MYSDYRSPRDFVLSGKATIPDMFEWNARENPNHPFFRFHDGLQLNHITYAKAIQGIRRVARYVKSCVETPGPEVVAILANADTISYITTSVGILRAGCTMFLISPRNSPAAVADMLHRTNCRHVLVSQDAPIQSLAKAAVENEDGILLHLIPTYEDMFPDALSTDIDTTDDLPKDLDPDAICVIVHSSGSTSHPKPIRSTNRAVMKISRAPWNGEVDLTMSTFSVHGLPMFHGMSLMMYCWAVNNGITLSVFPPASPPTFPTPEKVFESVVKTSSEYVMAAPAFVELWARDSEKVKHLKTMKGVVFGGAPLDQRLGDTLAADGVRLYNAYGSSELGAISQVFPANPGMDWMYFKFEPMLNPVMMDAGDGKYELVVVSTPEMPLPKVNTKVGEQDAFASSDLLEPHPTRPGWWRYYGRRDDQLILSNGEKTNPVPLENIIRDDPHVFSCMMFGHGKFQNGVLIEPKPDYKFDPQNIGKLEEFRNKIWVTIERVNEFAPQHSRIFKEMIIVTSPSKPFKYSNKGYPVRATVLKDYQNEIEAVYAESAESAQSDIATPATWDSVTTRIFIKTIVESVLKKPLVDDADFFRNGCDSLQATWIRNTILRALREKFPTVARQLNMNIVFQAPTISSLADAVLNAVHNVPTVLSARSADDLVRIAERYSSDLPARPSPLRPRESGKDVVLVTGTTGGFGCDVLEHLLRDDQVARVYAFNRQGSQAMDRQRARFRERSLDEELLSSPKFRMVEVALDVPGFGIEPELLDEIRDSLTHIMHNAWTVNFVFTLPSFEADLKAVRNLIELSLSSPHSDPPRIQFTSSVGIFEHCTIEPPVPEVPVDLSSALGAGYSESKWIAERILYNAADHASVSVVVVRLGQISGDKTGHWNEREWFPALVKSAIFTRCLPDIEGDVSFFLSYPAARAFVEMRKSTERILHLVHPRPVPWHTLITPIAEELGVPLVPYSTWLVALEKTAGVAEESAAEAIRDNPALPLLYFFRSRPGVAKGREPLGLPCLSTEKAQRASETLAQMPVLGETEARRWVAAWRASGFLE